MLCLMDNWYLFLDLACLCYSIDNEKQSVDALLECKYPPAF